MVRFIREQGAVAGIQLGHSGRKARANRPWEGDGPLQRRPEIEDWEAWQPVAPSAIAHSEKWPVPRPLETREVKDLFSIREVTLKNRVVPPMHPYSAVKGFPTDWHLMNAGKFAAGGAGLVIVESTKVERRGCGTIGDLGIWDDAFIEP